MSGQTISGVRTWLVQRISALYIALFFVYVIVSLILLPAIDYVSWRDWVNQPVSKSLIGVFVVSLLLHAWIGLRDIFLDYLQPFALRFTVLVLAAFFFLGLAVWMFSVLFSIGAA
ncbi:MAG: succinate dehydrogenase, hydrophobic membrane anchor protein [Thiohalomonadales bacterium]